MTPGSDRSEKFAGILDAIPVPAALAYDREARDVAINAAFAALLGVSRERFIPFAADDARTMPFSYEFEGKPLSAKDAPLARAARGETVTAMRLEVVRADGSRRTIDGWASPLHAGAVAAPGAICVFADVSAQKDAERRYRDLAELTPALLFAVDPVGNVAFANERWRAATGMGAEELLGTGWHRVVHPDDRDRTLRAWARSLARGTPFDADVRLRGADGTYRWVQLRAECARDEAGRIVRWFGSGFDTEVQHRAIETMRLLGAIGAFVADDTAVPKMLEDISAAALDSLADICFFDLRAGDGTVRRYVEIAAGIDRHVRELVLSLAPPNQTFRDGHAFPLAVSRGEAIHVERVDDEWLRDAAANTEVYHVWRRVGYHSIISVPLRSSGRPLGNLTILRTRGERSFEPIDVRVVEEVGRRVGLALEKIGFAEAARREFANREEEFRTLADVMPQLMWVADAAGEIRWRNRRWQEYTGLEAGTPGYSELALHPAEIDEVTARWAACRRTGEPFDMEHRLRRHDGTYRWFLSRATCSRDETGSIGRWYGSNTDIDDQRRASLTLQIFANLGEVLSESLGLQRTLEAAMEIVVPNFADWSFVNLMDDAGALCVAAIYHPERDKNRALHELLGERYARAGVAEGSGVVLRSREPYLYRRAGYEDAARVVEPAVLDVLWKVGFHSVLVVPLIVGPTVRGTLNVVMNESRREFARDDIPFFRELARRLAPAIANAEVYERERRVAQTFQEAALPATLPQGSGFTFDAIYEAGRAEALIGGDWYDAFRLVDGRIVVSIGDVAGSGLRAAVTMANMRQAIRGVAQVHADPALMLEAADRTLRAETPDRFVTAFVGVLDGVAGTLAYASAGHPPPLVRHADGTIEELACGGPPLGLRDDVRGGGHVFLLPDDAFIVFYTDGLTESTHDLDEGERRLRAAVADPDIANADEPAYAIYKAVLVEGSRDDVAILTVKVRPGSTQAHWSLDALDAAAAHRTQRQLREQLVAMHVAGQPLIAAELVIAELIGNTVRYAPGPIDVLLEVVNGRAIAHVLDRGPGFEFSAKLPPDLYSETGRGLFLIASFSDDFHVMRREGGGSHARVVLAR